MPIDFIEISLPAMVAFAAATQRVTGIGFALICTPFFVLATDPLYGVLIANALCVVLNIVVLAQTWRSVDIRRIFLLVIAGVVAIPIGQYVALCISSAVLMIAVGFMVLIGLALIFVNPRIPKFRDSWGAIIAGSLSGFMNVTAGVGGPAIALYAAQKKWDQRSFVASVQLYFLIINFVSVLAENPTRLSLPQTLTFTAFLLAGSVAGHYIAKAIKQEQARIATLVIAGFGAIMTVIKGILAII